MFGNLQERLTKSLDEVAGVARLDESNIKGTLREVRMALLEADVASVSYTHLTLPTIA